MKLTKPFKLVTMLALGLLPIDASVRAQDEDAAAEEAAPAATDEPAAAEAAPEEEAAPAAVEEEAPAAVEEEAAEPEAKAHVAPQKAAPAKAAVSKKGKAAAKAPVVEEEEEEEEEEDAAPAGAAASGGQSETGSGDEAPPVDAAAVAGTGSQAAGPFDFLSEGKRLELKEGDFSIEPPKGWEVYLQQTGLTLFMQPPHDPKYKYQRTIQVATFDGPRYMDDLTATEFEAQIPQKFSQASNSIVDYKVRNHLPVEMGDSRNAMLFYTEFKLQDVQLMQAHILVSSEKFHYLLTYTDVASHFENEAESQYLTEAWAAMTSVQLKGKSPVRYESTILVLGLMFGSLLLAALIWFVRNWRAKRSYEYYGSGKGLDDVDVTQEAKMLSPEGAPESGVSGMSFAADDDDTKRA